MPNVTLLEPAQAPADVKELYEDFQRRMGFPAPPNFIKAQGHSLPVAQGTWGLVQNVLVRGSLPRSLKEMMFSAISRDRGCAYCEAAHLACCRMLGVDTETLDKLTNDIGSLSPAKVRDIIEFGRKAARGPRTLEPADFERLRGHGMSQGEILEVISMAGLAVYANIMADATAVEADTMFTSF